MKLGRIIIEKRADAEQIERLRENADNARRQVGGRRGEAVARRCEREIADLDRVYDGNGTRYDVPPAAQDIKFGPRDDDAMPASWASRGLTWLHEHNPKVFGDMMLAITDTSAKPKRTAAK
jgi:hypothetical protein